jgi:hypothetical protein
MTTDLEDRSRRLEASRVRMRDWMKGTSTQAGETRSTSALPMAARMVERAGNDALRDTAERHPIALVGVAVAGGALIAWARPWRGVLSSALVAGLASQFGARLVSQIPIASVIEAIQGLAQAPTNESTPEGLRPRG